MFLRKSRLALLAAALSLSLTACGFRSVPATIEKLFGPHAPVSSPPAVPSVAGGSGGNESLFPGTDSSGSQISLSLFWAEDGDRAWQDDRLLFESSWEYLYLSEADAKARPALANTLEAMNLESARMGASWAEELREYASAAGYINSYMQYRTVQRVDGSVLSILTTECLGRGNLLDMHAVNLDPATGRELTLADVFLAPDALPGVLEPLLEQHYAAEGQIPFDDWQRDLKTLIAQEEFDWVVGCQNVTFILPSYMDPYYASPLCVPVWFDESPSLFQEWVLSPPDQYVLKLIPGIPAETDLDSRDGRRDTILTIVDPDEHSDCAELAISVNGVSHSALPDDEAYACSVPDLYLVHFADGRYVLYMDASVENDFHFLSVYRTGTDGMRLLERFWGFGFYENFTDAGEKRTALFTDPSDFVLATRLELLGTMWGTGHYRAGPPHGLPQEKSPYFELINTNLLTTKRALEAMSLPDESPGDLPAGTSLTFLRTDCRGYVDMRAENGREWRILVDPSQCPVTVNGIPADECFEGMLFTG